MKRRLQKSCRGARPIILRNGRPERLTLLSLAASREQEVGVERDAGDGGDRELNRGRNWGGGDEALDGARDCEEGDAAHRELYRFAAAEAQVVEARDVAGEE